MEHLPQKHYLSTSFSPVPFATYCMAHAYFTITTSSGSDHKRGKWEGAKAFCTASVSWSCCSAVESAEPKITQTYRLNNLYAEHGVVGMGLTTHTRTCQLASSYQGPTAANFQFVISHGDSPEGLKQDPRNWPRADTHKQMTHVFNYLASLSLLRLLLQEGHLPALKETHLF